MVERRALVGRIRHADRYWMSANVNLLHCGEREAGCRISLVYQHGWGATFSPDSPMCRDSAFCDTRRVSWNGADLWVRSGANTHRPFASSWCAL